MKLNKEINEEISNHLLINILNRRSAINSDKSYRLQKNDF